MAKPRNKVMDSLAYLAVRLGAMGVHMLGPNGAYGLAKLAGRAFFALDRKHRRIAEGQIRLSYPDWDDGRVRRCARGSFEALALLGVEMLLTPRLIHLNRWRRHIRLHNFQEMLDLLLAGRTGVIVLMGHFGNWEVGGYTLATLGFPSVSVARPLDNPYLNEFLLGVRQRTGQRIVDKGGATAEAGPTLEAKGILGLIADQDAGKRGVFVDFFGRPASTFRSIALLARTYEVPVAVTYAKRTGRPFQFELGVQRIIHPHEWADKDDEVRWLTQTYTAELEAVVRTAPEQYLWAHRRWKHRPGGGKAEGGIG